MITRTHAPGCTYTLSAKARCTCHWAKVIAEEEARRPIPPEVLVPAFDKEKLLLQRLETHVRNPPRDESERARWDSDFRDLLKAIDEARK